MSNEAKCLNHCEHHLSWTHDGVCRYKDKEINAQRCGHVCTFAPPIKVQTSASGRRFVDIDDVIEHRLAAIKGQPMTDSEESMEVPELLPCPTECIHCKPDFVGHLDSEDDWCYCVCHESEHDFPLIDYQSREVEILERANHAKTPRDRILRLIAGALRLTIDAHGPITKEWTGSAAKRIYSWMTGNGVLNTRVSAAQGSERVAAEIRRQALEEAANTLGEVAGLYPHGSEHNALLRGVSAIRALAASPSLSGAQGELKEIQECDKCDLCEDHHE